MLFYENFDDHNYYRWVIPKEPAIKRELAEAHKAYKEKKMKNFEWKKGTYAWALQQLAQGKKVRRGCWDVDSFWYACPDTREIKNHNNAVMSGSHASAVQDRMEMLSNSSGWELYEEKPKLPSTMDPIDLKPTFGDMVSFTNFGATNRNISNTELAATLNTLIENYNALRNYTKEIRSV